MVTNIVSSNKESNNMVGNINSTQDWNQPTKKQMQKLQNNVTPITDTTWITVRDIKKQYL